MKRRGWQLLIIPDGESKVRQFRLPRNVVLTVVGLVILLVVYAMVETALFWSVARKAAQVEPLKQKVRELENSNTGLTQMGRELNKLKTFEKQLKKALSSGSIDSLGLSPLTKLDLSQLQAAMEQSDEAKPTANNLIKATSQVSSEVPITAADMPTQTPIKGFITRNYIAFGPRSSSAHHGIDIAAKPGTPIVAAADGLVVFSDWTYEYGNLVVLQHRSEYTSFYGHNQLLLVKSGDRVRQGEPIATLGSSGKSSAPHLHYEVWQDGIAVDPLTLFRSSP